MINLVWKILWCSQKLQINQSLLHVPSWFTMRHWPRSFLTSRDLDVYIYYFDIRAFTVLMNLKRKSLMLSSVTQGRRRRGGAGGGGGGTCLPTFKSGGHKWVCAPPPLLGRANVLNSLFAHILWLKTQNFQNFLGSLRSPTLINQYFLNFANLKL